MKLDEGMRPLGVDRVLAAYAAYRLVNDSCIVIDAGTAVTIDAVTKDGTFAGGFIFPGKDLLSWSLAAKTDLPYISSYPLANQVHGQ